ncbi:MAG TPA: gliding motility-associated C-terminal domain-containing protein [Saprospiraceae bacterium]|nr:gliding motility-associated C-terminal domain-containing protein [Saprospiraceae bacterium]
MLDNPDPLIVETSISNPTCNSDNGSINLYPQGGNLPNVYFFSWNDGDDQQNRNQLQPGTYEVIVTNENGCSINLTIFLADLDEDINLPDKLEYCITNDLINKVKILPDSSERIINFTYKVTQFPRSYLRFVNLNAQGILSFEVKENFTDPLRITIEVCNNCENCTNIELEIVNEFLKNIIKTNLITPYENSNNTLQLSEEPIEDSEIWIYNRWGHRIFHAKNYQNDWDASGYVGGVYYYVYKAFGLTTKNTLTVIK